MITITNLLTNARELDNAMEFVLRTGPKAGAALEASGIKHGIEVSAMSALCTESWM